MEDIAIGATAVIGIVGGIAANVEIPEPADGAQVLEITIITIGGKVVQVQTMLTVTVVTALVTHVEVLVVNAPATATMATTTTTTVDITKAVPTMDITKVVQQQPL
jgi:hypothetical protein